MRSEVCMYSKFGFCKFKDNCRSHHFHEECVNLLSCKSVKTCDKRHPKPCNNFNSKKGCTRTNCAYNHQHSNKSVYEDVLKENMEIMEKALLEMSTKIIDLEKELKEIKSKNNNAITTEKYKEKKKKKNLNFQ